MNAEREIALENVRASKSAVEAQRMLENKAIAQARAAGLSWEEIGRVYEVSRQAAHSRWSKETQNV